MILIFMSYGKLLSIGCINSLINLIKYKNTFSKGKTIIIGTHNYSLNSKTQSYNTKISSKEMLTLEEIIKWYPNNKIKIFNQGSTQNGINVSRGTGIKVTKDGKIFANNYDSNWTHESDELARIINSHKEFKDFVVKNALTSPLRSDKEGNQFHASFLHDVKVLYILQNFNELENKEIIIPCKIWEKDGLYTDLNKVVLDHGIEESRYMGIHYLVNTDKLSEYNKGFNKWLNDVLHQHIVSILHVDGISTDAFLGYKSDDGVYHTDIAQDFDDACALWLLEEFTLGDNKTPVIVSDEFVVYNEQEEKYEGLRTTAIKENFEKFDVQDDWTVISSIKGFNMDYLTDWNKQRIMETSDGPVVDSNAVSHYKNFFGIYQRQDNKVTLKPPSERTNGFENDQVEHVSNKLENEIPSILYQNGQYSCLPSEIEKVLKGVEFTIVRNAKGRGGTPYAKEGETGSISADYYTVDGSMSEYHQFIIINDLIYWWSNCAFFGKGPGKYGVKGSLILCYKLRELANKWAEKHEIKNPLFGFHEHPNNSLPSLHLHLLDADNRNDVAWYKHIYNTISLDDIIRRLESELRYENILLKVVYNWMPIFVVLLSIYLFYPL